MCYNINCECQPKPTPQFKVGNMVFSLINGWVEVTDQYSDGSVQAGGWMYTSNGAWTEKGMQILFHDKPTIIPAKRKVKAYKYAYEFGTAISITKEWYTEIAWDRNKNIERMPKSIKLPWTEIEVEE